MEHGAALRQHQPEGAAHWLADWLADGTLAQAAWSGFRSLPKQGLYEIADVRQRRRVLAPVAYALSSTS